MPTYVHGTVLTQYGIASNNRGENDGNVNRLQKIHWRGRQHTVVSAEAIRYALRSQMPDHGLKTNRRFAPSLDGHDTAFEWVDGSFANSAASGFADDDVLGYMLAKTTKGGDGNGGEDAEAKKEKDATVKRTGRLNVNRAVSLDPYFDEFLFASGSCGASPGAVSKKTKSKQGNDASNPTPYTFEVHATRYQFPFSLEVDSLRDPSLAPIVIRILAQLSKVGGNHGRSFYDFSAESLFLRVTTDPAHRMGYCFQCDEEGEIIAPNVPALVESGDIDPTELFVGGRIRDTEDAKQLFRLAVQPHTGVKHCVQAVCERITDLRK